MYTDILSKRAVVNNEKEFKKLFDTYYPALCLYCKRFIDEIETREDIVQDTFVTLWNKREEIQFDDSAVFFLKACARNSCLNHLNHQSYKQKYVEEYLEKNPMYDKSVDSLYTIGELQELLKKTLSQLPEEYKKVYVMSYLEGKTNIEIAEILGVSTKTVERYKSKSVTHLREGLKDYLPTVLLDFTIFYLFN